MIIVAILLILVIATIATIAWRMSITSTGLEVNHNLLCAFGFLLYWLFPIAVGVFRLFPGASTAGDVWYGLFDAIPEEELILFLCLTAGCAMAFFGGSHIGKLLYRRKTNVYRRLYFAKNLVVLPAIIGVALSAVYAFFLRGALFRGYTKTLEGQVTLGGPLIASSLFLLAASLIYSTKMAENDPEATFKKLATHKYFVCFWIVAILVMSLGNRLYFMSAIVTMLVYRSVYFKRLPLAQLAIFVAAIVFAAGLFGSLRFGGKTSSAQILVSVAEEPLLTSISMLASLKQGIDTPVRVPVFLLSSFLNLVPSALFPSKVSFMLDATQSGFDIYVPNGATHSYTSFMINFGDLGTIAAMFFIGLGMSRLKYRDHSLLDRVVYVMLAGCIPFTFFRDPFSTSIVKNMCQFSIFTPWALVVVLQLITLAIKPRTVSPTRGDSKTQFG